MHGWGDRAPLEPAPVRRLFGSVIDCPNEQSARTRPESTRLELSGATLPLDCIIKGALTTLKQMMFVWKSNFTTNHSSMQRDAGVSGAFVASNAEVAKEAISFLIREKLEPIGESRRIPEMFYGSETSEV
ncbi:hypothetical protein MRX96_054988 [Rhipicephalus microplus]